MFDRIACVLRGSQQVAFQGVVCSEANLVLSGSIGTRFPLGWGLCLQCSKKCARDWWHDGCLLCFSSFECFGFGHCRTRGIQTFGGACCTAGIDAGSRADLRWLRKLLKMHTSYTSYYGAWAFNKFPQTSFQMSCMSSEHRWNELHKVQRWREMELAGHEQCVEVCEAERRTILKKRYVTLAELLVETIPLDAEEFWPHMAGFTACILYPNSSRPTTQADVWKVAFEQCKVDGQMRSPSTLLDPRKEEKPSRCYVRIFGMPLCISTECLILQELKLLYMGEGPCTELFKHLICQRTEFETLQGHSLLRKWIRCWT